VEDRNTWMAMAHPKYLCGFGPKRNSLKKNHSGDYENKIKKVINLVGSSQLHALESHVVQGKLGFLIRLRYVDISVSIRCLARYYDLIDKLGCESRNPMAK
jgi:hypothetical protein